MDHKPTAAETGIACDGRNIVLDVMNDAFEIYSGPRMELAQEITRNLLSTVTSATRQICCLQVFKLKEAHLFLVCKI